MTTITVLTTVGFYLWNLCAIINSLIDNNKQQMDEYPFGPRKYVIPAKEISIVELLQNCNIHPQYVRGQDYWYLSPLREEKTPSFTEPILRARKRPRRRYHRLGRQLFQCDTKVLLEKLGSGHFLFHPQQLTVRAAHIDRTVTSDKQANSDPDIGHKEFGK
ncbi:hypothetical protein [Dyadobacter alkalitolerans]|uniref:hypothetical protein n=1 Tax=Dyadobacter alkalitolerans TaxID=492736 RepID=UPI0012F95612|nr:hypothetical protein [Dyadobacter alkalitolerans]